MPPPTSDSAEEPSGNDRGLFVTTRWSVVRAAVSVEGNGDAAEALAWLCERYWFPLYVFVRGRGKSPADAEDVVQGFFAKVLEAGSFSRAESTKGTFRSFLLSCLTYHMADDYRRSQAQKRGGGLRMVSLDDHEAEDWLQRDVPGGRTPEQDYDRAWALALLDRVMNRLKVECDADGKTGRFDVLRPFLDGECRELSLVAAAEAISMSLGAVKSIIHRLRGRMRELVRDEIQQTVSTEADVVEELKSIFAALRS